MTSNTKYSQLSYLQVASTNTELHNTQMTVPYNLYLHLHSPQRLTAVGIRCADHVTPLYPQNLALTSPTGGGRSVGIVRSRTKATEFFFYITILSLPVDSPSYNLVLTNNRRLFMYFVKR